MCLEREGGREREIEKGFRDVYSGAREDATAGEPSASDEAALLVEARPSPMDLGKAREATDAIIKFLQVRRLEKRYNSLVFLGL